MCPRAAWRRLLLGHGEIGQLGDGTTASRFPPKPIAASSRFVEISNTCARTSGGAVHCWGQNDYGQAGPSTGELCQAHDATFNCVTRPQAIQVPAGVTAIEQGAFFACALVASGAVYCWGSDDGGKLGTGQLEPVQNPSPLRVVGTGA